MTDATPWRVIHGNQIHQGFHMKTDKIIAYKGFNKDWTCRRFAYQVGESYTCDGDIEACCNGFHACPNPLSVWSFYDISNGHRFAVVEQSGEIVEDGNKTASRKITIKAEIGIPGLIKAAVEWTQEAAKKPTSGDYAHSATSGDYANSATSGHYAN